MKEVTITLSSKALAKIVAAASTASSPAAAAGGSTPTARSTGSGLMSPRPTGTPTATTDVTGVATITGAAPGGGDLVIDISKLCAINKKLLALYNEIHLLQQFRHPNIIRYLGMTVRIGDSHPGKAGTAAAAAAVPLPPGGPPAGERPRHHRTTATVVLYLEYASQGSLRSHVSLFKHIAEDVAARYCRQMLLGLDYLHSLGILHRVS